MVADFVSVGVCTELPLGWCRGVARAKNCGAVERLDVVTGPWTAGFSEGFRCCCAGRSRFIGGAKSGFKSKAACVFIGTGRRSPPTSQRHVANENKRRLFIYLPWSRDQPSHLRCPVQWHRPSNSPRTADTAFRLRWATKSLVPSAGTDRVVREYGERPCDSRGQRPLDD